MRAVNSDTSHAIALLQMEVLSPIPAPKLAIVAEKLVISPRIAHKLEIPMVPLLKLESLLLLLQRKLHQRSKSDQACMLLRKLGGFMISFPMFLYPIASTTFDTMHHPFHNTCIRHNSPLVAQYLSTKLAPTCAAGLY